MFSGTPKGARSSTILYSLVESAKLHELSVYEYFYYIFKQLPGCSKKKDFEALLRYNLNPATLKI
jgi:hypothetical protein